MAEIIHRHDWDRPGLHVTPEGRFLDRRRFMRATGLGALLAPSLLPGCLGDQDRAERIRKTIPKAKPPFPARPNPAWKVAERGITPELTSAAYNNFYELGVDKSDPWKNAHRLTVDPWTIDVGGLCAKPMKIGREDLLQLAPLEERVYRFRCVEAWASTVPWTGFPLAKLLAKVEPKSEATHVRFLTVHQKDLPGIQRMTWYTWPYYEGLTLAEATHELTLLTVGCYGHALPAQHGAPVRVIVPWKYGYKSPKSIVKIELVKGQPRTFWNDANPDEYGFSSNVNPKVPHPRWSQATERLLDDGSRRPTLPLNGYARHVGELYG